jgi:hypothetical protein
MEKAPTLQFGAFVLGEERSDKTECLLFSIVRQDNDVLVSFLAGMNRCGKMIS